MGALWGRFPGGHRLFLTIRHRAVRVVGNPNCTLESAFVSIYVSCYSIEHTLIITLIICVL